MQTFFFWVTFLHSRKSDPECVTYKDLKGSHWLNKELRTKLLIMSILSLQTSKTEPYRYGPSSMHHTNSIAIHCTVVATRMSKPFWNRLPACATFDYGRAFTAAGIPAWDNKTQSTKEPENYSHCRSSYKDNSMNAESRRMRIPDPCKMHDWLHRSKLDIYAIL